MKRYFVETSTIINFLRNKQNAVAQVKALEGELTSSYICLAELYEGINRVENPKELEKGVLDFFSGLSEVYGVDLEVAQKFGKTRATLKKRGEIIEDIDLFIAATCLAENLTLVTYNAKHFQRIVNLDILAL